MSSGHRDDTNSKFVFHLFFWFLPFSPRWKCAHNVHDIIYECLCDACKWSTQLIQHTCCRPNIHSPIVSSMDIFSVHNHLPIVLPYNKPFDACVGANKLNSTCDKIYFFSPHVFYHERFRLDYEFLIWLSLHHRSYVFVFVNISFSIIRFGYVVTEPFNRWSTKLLSIFTENKIRRCVYTHKMLFVTR